MSFVHKAVAMRVRLLAQFLMWAALQCLVITMIGARDFSWSLLCYWCTTESAMSPYKIAADVSASRLAHRNVAKLAWVVPLGRCHNYRFH